MKQVRYTREPKAQPATWWTPDQEQDDAEPEF